MDVGSWQMIAGLVVGICVLVGLILYSRIHAFPALIIAAIVTGLVGGMPFSKVIASVTKGFGGTLGSIGIIIGFGIMMGAIFEKSGAAKRMAKVFLKLFGKGREELALATTGFIVSIPIFCDSGFVILSPLAKASSPLAWRWRQGWSSPTTLFRPLPALWPRRNTSTCPLAT